MPADLKVTWVKVCALKGSYLLNGLKFQCCLPAEVPLLVGMEWLQVPAARLLHHQAALAGKHAHSQLSLTSLGTALRYFPPQL